MQWSLHTIVEWTSCKRTCRIIWEKLQAIYYINWTYLWQCFNKWSDDTRKILGWNHTRAALQRLVKSSECTQKREISVCLYGRLSKFDPGSGSVSCFKHNELHENSQELSFSEKVMFFHKVLLDCERKFAG